MEEQQKINVSNRSSGVGLGFFLFLSVWLIFGRGCEGQPSNFEHWLKASYQYESIDANWPHQDIVAPVEPLAHVEMEGVVEAEADVPLRSDETGFETKDD